MSVHRSPVNEWDGYFIQKQTIYYAYCFVSLKYFIISFFVLAYKLNNLFEVNSYSEISITINKIKYTSN